MENIYFILLSNLTLVSKRRKPTFYPMEIIEGSFGNIKNVLFGI